MNPIFRRFWIIGMVFSSVIDIATTYWLIQRNLFINIFEGGRWMSGAISFLGPELALFGIGPILVAGFIWITLRLCDKFWPTPSAPLVNWQIAACYLYLLSIFGFKFFSSALNTVSLLRLRETI